ncbi:MAG: hypothetical protein CMJ70_00045 [Planctomycetaceae bacterium]|nr:hypothetical protein [Planctomycetaceae bacterium]
MLINLKTEFGGCLRVLPAQLVLRIGTHNRFYRKTRHFSGGLLGGKSLCREAPRRGERFF